MIQVSPGLKAVRTKVGRPRGKLCSRLEETVAGCRALCGSGDRNIVIDVLYFKADRLRVMDGHRMGEKGKCGTHISGEEHF